MSTLFKLFMKNINHIHPKDNDYLQILASIDEPPKTLYYIGEIPEKRCITISIVGSRKPTSYGREVTEQLAGELARRGAVIVSGLALGVDAIAHKAALDAGGTTLAVLANGLHRIYPATNRQLGEQVVASGGAIISENEPGFEPHPYDFLKRNRLVSGIADIVIVTEANARSGTLNTAAHALTQGRDVYAVPGNISSPLSAGCNQLILQGATPIVSVSDFVASLFADGSAQQQLLPIGATPLENEILQAIASGLRDGDAILRTTSATATEFNTALTMLEINGVIKSLGANQWTLR